MINPHIEYLKVMFGKYRREWENEHDDRKIFCVIYDRLIEAFELAESLDNNTISCALNHYSKRDIASMQEIADYFMGKTQRNGHYFNPAK